jgi:hypothetical protein
LRIENKESRTKNQEQRIKNKESRTKNQEQRSLVMKNKQIITDCEKIPLGWGVKNVGYG